MITRPIGRIHTTNNKEKVAQRQGSGHNVLRIRYSTAHRWQIGQVAFIESHLSTHALW
jgi:hypothetical protein